MSITERIACSKDNFLSIAIFRIPSGITMFKLIQLPIKPDIKLIIFL